MSLSKQHRRNEKDAHRALKYPKSTDAIESITKPTGPVDCACVIHGDTYSWRYVDILYNMLTKNLTRPVNLHVYTETNRAVPAPYIKHELMDFGITGPKKSWWYKMQLFNNTYYNGPLLYLDLDVVIVNNIDWVWNLPLKKFWAVKDFKHLWRPTFMGINSSMMYWDTGQYNWIWENFKSQDLRYNMRKYHGDQDYITAVMNPQQLRHFNSDWVKSWRWQCLDGGYDFKRRVWQTPGIGTQIQPDTNIMIFHGNPKPDQIVDPVIQQYWQ